MRIGSRVEQRFELAAAVVAIAVCGVSLAACTAIGAATEGATSQDATVGVDSSAYNGGAASGNASSFAAKLISFTPGASAGFGADNMPSVVLGAPNGGGAHKGSLDVVSLGKGGEIVLKLSGTVVDGPGVDLIVFENPFAGFVETGRVAVSTDGATWHEWPCACDDKAGGYPGCAGTKPVFSNPDNDISPLDPATAGGNAFDLADIAIKSGLFLRVTDTGKNEYLGKTGGFDLDAVAVVHAGR